VWYNLQRFGYTINGILPLTKVVRGSRNQNTQPVRFRRWKGQHKGNKKARVGVGVSGCWVFEGKKMNPYFTELLE
jgi:hypothetical protein